MDEGRCVLFFAAPINRRALSLKRIGETSSQRHNLRLPGAVNQRARLRPPSYQDSDRPESSRCLARALACNESAKHSLDIASQYMENETTTIDVPVEVYWNKVDDFLMLSPCSTKLIREGRDGAAMASSAKDSVTVIMGKSVAMVDCGTL